MRASGSGALLLALLFCGSIAWYSHLGPPSRGRVLEQLLARNPLADSDSKRHSLRAALLNALEQRSHGPKITGPRRAVAGRFGGTLPRLSLVSAQLVDDDACLKRQPGWSGWTCYEGGHYYGGRYCQGSTQYAVELRKCCPAVCCIRAGICPARAAGVLGGQAAGVPSEPTEPPIPSCADPVDSDACLQHRSGWKV